MKILSIIKYALIAICVIIVLAGGVFGENVDLMLRWTYILLGLTVALVIILPLLYVAENPKGALRGLLGLVGILVVIGIAYALSDTNPIETPAQLYDNPTQLRISDIGLYTTYIALLVAIVTIVYGEIRNAFK